MSLVIVLTFVILTDYHTSLLFPDNTNPSIHLLSTYVPNSTMLCCTTTALPKAPYCKETLKQTFMTSPRP